MQYLYKPLIVTGNWYLLLNLFNIKAFTKMQTYHTQDTSKRVFRLSIHVLVLEVRIILILRRSWSLILKLETNFH